MSGAGRSYRFHPLERRGLVVGLGAAQLGCLAAGLVGAVVALRAIGGAGGVAAGLLVAGAAAGGACWPVAGRTPLGWAPVAAGWLLRRAGGPVVAPPGLPAPPAGVRLLQAPRGPGDEPLGVVRDTRAGTWAAVLPVAGRAFTLLDGDDKRHRLAAWGAVLASMARAGHPVHRLQWIERTVPADPRAGAGRSPDSEAGLPAAVESYRELVGGAGPAASSHEVLLVVAVHPRRAGRHRRAFGRGADATCALLRRELRLLRGQLRRADLDPGHPLDLAELAAAVRAASDPRPARQHPPDGDAGAWPVGWDDRWSVIRVDGRWHATYWVAEWPRSDVGPDFLTPLLHVGGARAVAVTMAPVPPDQAAREVESARTAEIADAELRRRAGFVVTARNRRRAEGVAEREAELADGHGEVRFAGYVTVSGADPAELDDACAAVETAAHQVGVQLRRLHGQQAEAWTWTLPLGRGLA